MKMIFTLLLCATISFAMVSKAEVRETGGAMTFELALRQTPLGSTVLPAVEKELVAQGFVSGPLTVSWEDNGTVFRAQIWYRSSQSFATVQIILSGELKQDLDLQSIQIKNHNP